MNIVPGILTNNIDELRRQVNKIAPVAPYVQLDIVDGQFCAGETVNINELSPSDIVNVKAEVHLMVQNPLEYIPTVVHLGFKKMIFHFEAVSDPQTIISAIHKVGLHAGVALNPETDVFQIEKYIKVLDTVLIMSIHPGRQGNPFIPSVLSKASNLKNIYSRINVGIDGGIRKENILEVKKVGFDYAVVGSSISGSKDAPNAYLELQNMVK